jgi:hypothetical protein
MKKSKKKGLLIFAGVLAAVFVVLTVFGPFLVYKAAKQEEVADEYNYSESFLNSYEDVRANVQKRITTLKKDGVKVKYTEYAIDESDNLYIDNFYIPALKEQKNLIVLTTGVHGMEGYIGSVMLDVFFEEIYDGLNKDDTGVLVVANVNPYGMKYMRRYNENNVDLNRNFIMDWERFDLSSNKDYPKVQSFLEPVGKIGNAFWHEVGFYLNLAKEAIFTGADVISDALLTGQYESPQGVYYGGTGDEASTKYLKGVFNDCLEGEYENIVHIDIHSGYGPRYNMVIFNSVYETMTEAETKEAFGYDYVISHDSESFYATTGDTTDYFYRLAESKNTDKELFSTCFEFGTIGDEFMDTILSLKYTVDENRNHWYPTGNNTSAEVVKENYYELFYPTEKEWREKTIEDFKTATEGVLNAKLK